MPPYENAGTMEIRTEQPEDIAGVVVLGHAGYHPRFGFVPASRFGLVSE